MPSSQCEVLMIRLSSSCETVFPKSPQKELSGTKVHNSASSLHYIVLVVDRILDSIQLELNGDQRRTQYWSDLCVSQSGGFLGEWVLTSSGMT
jgi:hypothetical protein